MPTETTLAVVLATVHVVGVVEANTTGLPDPPPVAVSAIVALSAYTFVAGGLNPVIVWAVCAEAAPTTIIAPKRIVLHVLAILFV